MIRWFEKHNKLSWVITILIAVIIFYLSTLTFGGAKGDYGDVKNWISIVYHIVVFFFLSIFLFISLIKGEKNYSLFLLSVAILIVYGISDEIHQFFIPGRFCAILDLGFDFIGILFASMVYFISLIYRKQL